MIRRSVVALAMLGSFTACASAQPGGILGRAARIAGGVAAARAPIGLQKEIEIGRGIAATVAGRWGLVRNEPLQAYVNLVGQLVAQQSPRSTELTYRFAVLDTDEVNAFAAPGGYIFITRGLLDQMESEAELAAVLGHEIAHVDLRHILRRIQRMSTVQSLAQETEMTGPILDAVLSEAASMLFMNVERGDELESDSLGMLYASAAGYRADGMVRFLERMSQGEQQQRRGFAAIRATHPPASLRLEAAQVDVAAFGFDLTVGPTLEARFRQHVPRASAPPR
jgi:beta-barrel assembly-enhancing protease